MRALHGPVVPARRAWYSWNPMQRHDLRNVALVAHVDHGKTSVIEQLLRFAAVEHGEGPRADTPSIADAPLYPVVRITYGGVTINIIDTPAQGDFGGDIERAILLADGVMLIVDATEGPLPHTRFALRKAIEADLPIVVVMNKVDRSEADASRVVGEVRVLLEDLEATRQQFRFPVVYTVARSGLASRDLHVEGTSFAALLEALIEHVPPAEEDVDATVSMHVHRRIDDVTHGPLAIGRVRGGVLRPGMALTMGTFGKPRSVTPNALLAFDGRAYQRCELVEPGDIIAVAGLGDVQEGDVISMDPEPSKAAVRREVPALVLPIAVNRSPMAGKARSSHFLTARQIERRLSLAVRRQSGLRFLGTDDPDSYLLRVRGDLLLTTLVETMRREGYEFELGRPEVVCRESDAGGLEPVERAVVDLPAPDASTVIRRMQARGGHLIRMSDPGLGRARMEFRIPSRALFGFRYELQEATRGMALMTTLFEGWEPFRGAREARPAGAIVADRDGRATPYALFHLQPRGMLFVRPGTVVYQGMIVGQHNRIEDIHVNVTKERKVADVRSRAQEQHVLILPAQEWTVAGALGWVEPDEVVEITPEAVRVRKRG